jgi:hypothetical protein
MGTWGQYIVYSLRECIASSPPLAGLTEMAKWFMGVKWGLCLFPTRMCVNCRIIPKSAARARKSSFTKRREDGLSCIYIFLQIASHSTGRVSDIPAS